ncbi:DNA polymerase alpha subunit B [Venustampulla echinocandica]|uniref:DNA polymerase epsilon subunit B n=1 Tax=Venustampulla echinocandica TaxID=2656787 RepID=A0A370TPU8_9HELO|nr:DNA polymerase alpha subunit B [Venustampulla echinocandica]RDL37544.1 DNA polymerase alpha subunit B [Venustampulla echinocandica]
MTGPNPLEKKLRPASIFKAPATPAPSNPIPSSSPAFGTPAHPIRPFNAAAIPPKASILAIILPPPTLRPLAFRTFTKKHSLTLTSSALQVLATFIGRHCGTGWREEGLAERVLEEVAKSWKNRSGGVIVDGESNELKDILRNLEGIMIGGRIVASRELSRQNSLVLGSSQNGEVSQTRLGLRPHLLTREDSQSSLGMSSLDVDGEDEDGLKDPRKWLKVIDAFEQPRLVYNVGKKHFDRDPSKPSLLPQASHKTQVFRNRYNLIHQRLLRNESFQTSALEISKTSSKRSSSNFGATQQSYKLTPIANLLGRNRTNHMLLGLLTIAPTGTLAINDLTGSIALDLTHAKPIPEDGAWFAPGMIVLVDGTYEEDDNNSGTSLGSSGGIGGTIGGKFIGFFIGGPPCERRQVTLGLSGTNGEGDVTAGGGFGWVDFLGVGSERAVGSKMRKLEERLMKQPVADDEPRAGSGRMVIIGEVNLDQPQTLQALKKLLGIYAAKPEEDTPITFILMGNFVSQAVMARGGSGGSIEYKEYFDGLASTLSDYPTLLQSATFVFVPGDNDAWASSFSAGAATALPRKGIPEMFTSRIKRAFTTANAEAEKERGRKADGEAIWTTNPSRLCLFGPTHEILLFRDDMTGRLRRTAINFSSSKPSDEDGDEDGRMVDTPPPAPEVSGDMDVDPDTQTTDPQPAEKPTKDSVSSDLHAARKLVKTILDQGYLSPFGMAIRPVLWDYTSALQIYPLPTAMVIADTEAPAFSVTYEGCHVMNPGSVIAPGRRGVAKWVEYDVRSRVGKVKEALF